jgi:hypothetical protein
MQNEATAFFQAQESWLLSCLPFLGAWNLQRINLEGKTQLDTWPKRGTGHLPTQVTSIAESHWRSPSFRWTELEFGMCVFLAILNVSNLNIKLSWIDKLKINPGTSNRFRWNSMDTDWPTKVTPHGPFFEVGHSRVCHPFSDYRSRLEVAELWICLGFAQWGVQRVSTPELPVDLIWFNV